MSNSNRNRERMAAGTANLLDDALGAFIEPAPMRYDRWSRRIAVTFIRPQILTDAPVAADSWSLSVLQPRICRGSNGGIRRRLLLCTFRPVFDAFTGRGSFTCSSVHDLAVRRPGRLALPPAEKDHRLATTAVALAQALDDADAADMATSLSLPDVYWAYDDAPVFECTYDPDEWARAEVCIHDRRAWPAVMLARSRARRFYEHPVDGSPNPWADEEPPDDEHDGKWRLIDGIPTPACQRPNAEFIYLAPFLGRSMRNPAFAALREHDFLPIGMSYKKWLNQFSRFAGPIRHLDEPAWHRNGHGVLCPSNAAARFQVDIEARFNNNPTLCNDVLATMTVAADASGIPYDHDDPMRNDLAQMLQTPWTRLIAPNRAQVQVIKLVGNVSPEILTDIVGNFEVDLYNLGPQHGSLAQLDPDVVRNEQDRVIERVNESKRMRELAS